MHVRLLRWYRYNTCGELVLVVAAVFLLHFSKEYNTYNEMKIKCDCSGSEHYLYWAGT